MSRRKKKQKNYQIELIGIAVSVLMILSILQAGQVGLFINQLIVAFSGNFAFILNILILVYSIKIIINGKIVNLLNRFYIGFMIIIISIMTLMQLNMIRLINENNVITWNEQYNNIINGNSDFYGGGLIGNLLSNFSVPLFSNTGSYLIFIVLIIVGVILITNFSISEKYQKHKKNKAKLVKSEKPKVTAFAEEPVEITKEIPVNKPEVKIHKHVAVDAVSAHAGVTFALDSDQNYKYPDLNNLNEANKKKIAVSTTEIQTKSKLIEQTLQNFKIDVTVTDVHVGPAVTRFEMEPSSGTKVSRIANLNNDLALALAARDIRIEAPVPGKSVVGIEVPNDTQEIVFLKELLLSKVNITEASLQFALGKDISGKPIFAKLNEMPHVLIAGSTGSGKSVCVNTLIISILMKAAPTNVKFLMIDPKKVELTPYENIPHLLAPVITDPLIANNALQKMVAEMEERYSLFQETKTRNIQGYNEFAKNSENYQQLPYIVIIIDELADLMMIAKNEVETNITRLAQMARAAGMHLVIATQRPSVDVITGLIKANIPSRIAFAVASNVDSRTILDSQGAEKLLGRGDMLYLPQGENKPIRVQGAFLSDSEIQKVIDDIKNNNNDVPFDLIDFNQVENNNRQISKSQDPLFMEAAAVVINHNKASVSLLQRKLSIGYNRAAKLIDEMEAQNVVGPYNGSKPRQVLISSLEEIQNEIH